MDAKSPSNLFDSLPSDLREEQFTDVLVTAGFRVERIVSMGHTSPPGFWYDQDTHEWVLLLRGAARLAVEGLDAPVHLAPGDHLRLPAHRRHRVEWTDPETETVWLAIHWREEDRG